MLSGTFDSIPEGKFPAAFNENESIFKLAALPSRPGLTFFTVPFHFARADDDEKE